MAAVLAAGPQAVLSHGSAGTLWGILGSRKSHAARGVSLPIHLTVTGAAESRRGIRVHRSRSSREDEVTRRLRIPVTTPSRTLKDLRRTLPRMQFAAALRQAEYLGLPIEYPLEPDHTRSELESRFLALLRRHRLPQPGVNVRIGPHVVDFCWPAACLVVELDGYRAHGSRQAFERDRARDVDLRLRGYEVLRFTWPQLNARPADIAAALRSLL